MMIWPAEFQYEAVLTTVKPVTQEADADVKSALIKPIDSPDRVTAPRFNNNPPVIIKVKNPIKMARGGLSFTLL